jgi:nucleotide-binding universal stress UspA family protein
MPAVIREAAELSRALTGRLVLLNITAPPAFIASDDIDAAELIVEVTKAAEKSAVQKLAHLQQKLQADGITAVTRHRTGLAVVGIVEEAKKLDVDYIVLGSHGHGAVYDILVGSTAYGVLKKAKCPVVIVPAAPRKKA